MKILSLDLSTKSGWSLIDNGKLICYGLVLSKIDGDETHPQYPQNYIQAAKKMAEELHKIIVSSKPEVIVIEETNKGKNRYSQKCLEFIHYAVNDLYKDKVQYIDTSEWRSLLGISLSKEDRSANKEVSNGRKEKYDELHKEESSYYELILQTNLAVAKNKREKNKIQKLHDKQIDEIVKRRMKSFRFKKEGKVTGKIDAKTLSVNFVNEYFNLKFKKKDNDITDSICLGLAYAKKVNL